MPWYAVPTLTFSNSPSQELFLSDVNVTAASGSPTDTRGWSR
jgi:hypothetical protein